MSGAATAATATRAVSARRRRPCARGVGRSEVEGTGTGYLPVVRDGGAGPAGRCADGPRGAPGGVRLPVRRPCR
ncbi:hypothetical protein GCM10022273_36090 [Cellulomonas soli]